MRSVLTILAALLTSLAPLARAQSPAIKPVVAAEFAFAADALARGIKPAFLASMHDSAVYFGGAVPGLARAYWLTRPDPAPTDPPLRWAPALAGVAASGELGYTTGPWRMDGPDGKPVATGQFFTVWARQPDGTWRWLLDNGISAPLAAAPAALPTPAQVEGGTEPTPAGTSNQPLNVRGLDEQLSADIGRQGMAAAYATRLHARTRLLRDEQAPLTTAAAVRRQLGAEPAWQLMPAGGRRSASGELAYTYGRYLVPGAAGGSYVHLWLRTRGGWKLLLEITNPTPAAAR